MCRPCPECSRRYARRDQGQCLVEGQRTRPHRTETQNHSAWILALIRRGDNAYGVPICEELEKRTGRDVAIGSVYAALERLEDKGFVTSALGEATPERGGRAKRYIRVTGRGLKEVRETQRALIKLWHGLPELQEGKA